MNKLASGINGHIMILISGVLIFGACGSKSKSTNTPPVTHSANFHDISIANFAFSPGSLTIAAGDTVLWTNNQNVSHTVTSDTGSELAASLSSGATYQHIFMTAGNFPYHCTIHPSMHGSVTVQ
jgi:plastocyanin